MDRLQDVLILFEDGGDVLFYNDDSLPLVRGWDIKLSEIDFCLIHLYHSLLILGAPFHHIVLTSDYGHHSDGQFSSTMKWFLIVFLLPPIVFNCNGGWTITSVNKWNGNYCFSFDSPNICSPIIGFYDDFWSGIHCTRWFFSAAYHWSTVEWLMKIYQMVMIHRCVPSKLNQNCARYTFVTGFWFGLVLFCMTLFWIYESDRFIGFVGSSWGGQWL